ncbi:MAG: NPCBM/NEW2 domain-containing protein [Kiritimatiellae bacterium]|nr:NPCBM/NEW2 domain-containing protein [Kiritimatiellia bacterium]
MMKSMPICSRVALCLFAVSSTPHVFAETKIWLDELDLSGMSCGWETPRANAAVGGNPLKVGRKKFARGVGTHAESWFALETGGNAISFEAHVGVDDEELIRGKGSVVFRVYADQKTVADSGIIRARQPPKRIHADLTGASQVILHVSDAGDNDSFDHADWCDAFFVVKDGAALKPWARPLTGQMDILTPPAPQEPRINGARIFGARPGSPVLFAIPATGEEPLTYRARNLPKGLSLDADTGLITGVVETPGSYNVTLIAENAKGRAERGWRLELGDRIALTPPMGWNSWNCFAHAVSDGKIREAADAMVKSGLIRHGWSYINIDDYWQTNPGERNDATLMGQARDAAGRILPNKRFPDMKALADYVHGQGLKIGIYSSPGPLTCGGCVGSWQHEALDAQTYAGWGFDYLKYDWCSYSQVSGGGTLKELMRPYLLMTEALRAQKRDIVHSLCQYGMGNVSTWGCKAGGQCWRTTGDITDTWESMRKIADAQDGLELFAGPGSWNDPDMLVVGKVGWGDLHPTRLTPNEQYTHMSLWCLLCAPLLIGCDMTQLDAFTLNLLTNDEVLEVNQDPLGRQAERVQRTDSQEIWAKQMEDGSIAAGLFNRSLLTRPVTLEFETLRLTGKQRVRDLWRQKDMGMASDRFTAEIPGHGVLLIRLGNVNEQ